MVAAANIYSQNTLEYSGITINITNPDSGSVERNDIYRDDVLLGSTGPNEDYTDYEAASDVTYEYYVTTVGTDFTEANSDTVNGYVQYGNWWLKDPNDIESSIDLFVEAEDLQIKSTEVQAVFNPLGRKYPLVVKEKNIKADQFSISVQLMGDEEFDKFIHLRTKQKVLLLQSPMRNRQWYFVFGSEGTETVKNSVDPYKMFSIDIIEVGRP